MDFGLVAEYWLENENFIMMAKTLKFWRNRFDHETVLSHKMFSYFLSDLNWCCSKIWLYFMVKIYLRAGHFDRNLVFCLMILGYSFIYVGATSTCSRPRATHRLHAGCSSSHGSETASWCGVTHFFFSLLSTCWLMYIETICLCLLLIFSICCGTKVSDCTRWSMLITQTWLEKSQECC